jgi:glycosyltransferase involved in cell wall biosynthesis
MTVFNREQYVTEAIDSVLTQSYSDFELIIVDDCSTDGSYRLVQDAARKDLRIRVFQNAHNIGDYPNRNRAASYARGDYLKYVDADDTIYPCCLELMLEPLERCSHVAIVFNTSLEKGSQSHILSPLAAYRYHFFCSPLFYGGPLGSMIRKSVFEMFGGYPETRHTSDGEFHFALAQRYSVALVHGKLYFWRRHKMQESTIRRMTMRYRAKIDSKRFRIELNALANPKCPLPSQEISSAKSLVVRAIISKIGWFIRQNNPGSACILLQQAGPSFLELISALINRENTYHHKDITSLNL